MENAYKTQSQHSCMTVQCICVVKSMMLSVANTWKFYYNFAQTDSNTYTSIVMIITGTNSHTKSMMYGAHFLCARICSWFSSVDSLVVRMVDRILVHTCTTRHRSWFASCMYVYVVVAFAEHISHNRRFQYNSLGESVNVVSTDNYWLSVSIQSLMATVAYEAFRVTQKYSCFSVGRILNTFINFKVSHTLYSFVFLI